MRSDLFFNYFVAANASFLAGFDDCFGAFIERLFGSEQTLVFVSKGSFVPLIVSNPIMVVNSRVAVVGTNDFPCGYLFCAKNVGELKDVLEWFQKSALWNSRLNPRRKQLMVLEGDDDIEEVFSYVYKLNVVKMAVVVKLRGGLWKGYEGSICRDDFSSNVFRCGDDGLRLSSYPTKLKGCNFTASLIQSAYSLNDPEDPKRNPAIQTKPLLFLMEKYQLDVSFVIPSVEDQKKFFGGIERIKNIAMARHDLISISPARIGSTSRLYELSDILLRANRVWLVPKAKKLPNYQILATIFDKITWIGSFIATTAVVSVVWIISKMKRVRKYQTLIACLVDVLQVSIGSAAENIPSVSLIKLLFLLYSVYSFHMVYFFQTKLSGVLTVPTYEKSVRSSSDLARSDITPLVFFKGDHQLINLSGNALAGTIYKKCVVSNKSRSTEIVWKYRNVSALYSMGNLSKADMKLVNYFPDDLLVRSEIMYILQNGSFFLRYVNDIIAVTTENGFMLKWTAEWLKQPEKKFDSNIVLTLEHLQGAFYLLFLGYVASTAALIVEIMLFAVTKRPTLVLPYRKQLENN